MVVRVMMHGCFLSRFETDIHDPYSLIFQEEFVGICRRLQYVRSVHASGIAGGADKSTGEFQILKGTGP